MANATNHVGAVRHRRRDGQPLRMLPPTEQWMRRLGGAIKEQRQLADVTVFDLARRTGLSSVSLAAFERGSEWPSLRTLVRICDALRITMQELMP